MPDQKPQLVTVVITSPKGTQPFLFGRVPCAGERIVAAIQEDQPEDEWVVIHVVHMPRRPHHAHWQEPIADVHVKQVRPEDEIT